MHASKYDVTTNVTNYVYPRRHIHWQTNVGLLKKYVINYITRPSESELGLHRWCHDLYELK